MLKLTCAAVLSMCSLPMIAQSHPFVVTSPVNATTPLTVTLPATLADGKAAKTVVIEFVSADCQTLPGINAIGVARFTLFFQSNFAVYNLPFEQPMFFVNTTEFVSAQKTLMFADPGQTFSYGLSGATANCTVVFTGHLE